MNEARWNNEKKKRTGVEARTRREDNLIPNSQRSPEELREMGRKGGIKSGESRRKKRDLEKRMKIFMEIFGNLEKQGISTDEALTNLLINIERLKK